MLDPKSRGIVAKRVLFGKSTPFLRICFPIHSNHDTPPSSIAPSAAKLTVMTNKLHVHTQQDGITILTINRPEARNALDLETMRAFSEAVACLHDDPAQRVVIITGAGTEAFSSGADLHELSSYPSAEDARMMITIMGDALFALEHLPIPVIAAINGYALGGGSELALACDLRIADNHARMGFVQAKMGLTTGWGAGQRLLRLVGYPRALDLLLSGHVMRAPELMNYGLVNRVVEMGTALNYAVNYAQHVAKLSTDVVRGMKSLLQTGLHHPYDDALQIEREFFPPLWAAEAHAQAVEAFLRRDRGTNR